MGVSLGYHARVPDSNLEQEITALRSAALSAYGPQAVEEPAMAAALENVARALRRIQQEPLDPRDASLALGG